MAPSLDRYRSAAPCNGCPSWTGPRTRDRIKSARVKQPILHATAAVELHGGSENWQATDSAVLAGLAAVFHFRSHGPGLPGGVVQAFYARLGQFEPGLRGGGGLVLVRSGPWRSILRARSGRRPPAATPVRLL